MARIVLPIAGAVVGTFFGNPALGFAIGSALGNIVDPLKIDGPGIGDLQIQTGRENVPRPIIYGTAAVSGNLIFSGTPIVTKRKASGGGKGAPKVTESRQALTFAIRVCEGPIGGILRIWEDEKLVYDVRVSPEIPAADTALFAAGINIHLGAEDQLPDAAIEAEVGTGLAPYHRGSCYVVFVGKDLTDTGGRIQQYRFEVSANAIGNTEPTLQINLTAIPGSSNVAGVAYVNGLFIRWTGFPPQLPQSSVDCVNWSVGTVDSEFFSGQSDSPPVFFNGLWRVISGAGFTTLYNSTNGSDWINAGPAPFAGESSVANSAIVSGDWYVWDGLRRLWINDGVSWSNAGVVTDIPGSTFFRRLRSNGVSIVAVASNSKIVRSVDGLLWSDVTNPLMGTPKTVDWSPADNAYFAFSTVANVPTVWRSTDGGLTWQDLGIISTSQDPFDILAISETDWVFGQRGSASIKCSPSPVFSIALSPGDPVPLSNVVADISARAQLSASEIDTSMLTGVVNGYVLGGFFSASSALDPLRAGHFFDAGEWDGKIRFVPRGGDPVAAITEDELVGDPEETRRGQALEFPRKLHLQYQNAVAGYAPAKHTAERISQDVRVTGEIGASTPEVMDSDEAARRASIMLKISWIESAGQVTFAIPDSYSWITTTDIITLAVRGKTTRLRVETAEVADGIMTLTCQRDRSSALSSNAIGTVITPPPPPASTNPGVTEWHWLNIPALADTHDVLGSYFAAAGSSEGWAGAVLQRSTDGGATYSDTVVSSDAVLGTLLDPLPAAPADFTDAQNVIRVSLVNPGDELESVTYEQMLSEQNAVAIGGPGGWEIVQFQTAAEESPGIWQLSTLLRGRLNTTPLAHAVGDGFVELAGVNLVDNNVAHIGATLTHRGVGIGSSPESATVSAETYQPANTQREWAPEQVSAMLSGGMLSASWIARHRFGTSVYPVASINLMGYRVTIAGAGGQIEVDTMSTSASVDVSTLSAPLTVSVGAINRITGVGDLATVEVP